MKNSLMYKMSYYRYVSNAWEETRLMIDFFRLVELFGNGNAQDRVRVQKIPSPGTTLDYLGELCTLSFAQVWLVLTGDAEEAFTLENWIVSFVLMII
jgi:hypothetical protein